jgi:hypothetical protein
MAYDRCTTWHALALILTASFAPAHAAPIVLATSGFNDQSGINGNATPDSPFQIGVTVDGQGVGEPGWDGPWRRLGGFEDRAPVSSEFVHEGDASTKLFADNVFGTSIERAWLNIVPVVRIDAHVLVRPAASMRGSAVHTTMGGEIPQRTAAYWDIVSNGDIRVFRAATNQSISTGFTTLPNVWNKYSLILDTRSQTWTFLFNDQAFQSQALTFLNPTNFVDRVNLSAAGTLNSYVDAVRVTAIDANFDGNSIVDGADLEAWQAGFGESGAATHMQGDADGDSAVTGRDFLFWQRQLGVTSAGRIIPEPKSCASAIMLAGAVICQRYRRRRLSLIF